MDISFEDTKTSFAYKTDKELKKARFLFSSMGKEWLVKAGLWLTPLTLKLGLPVKSMIRKTIFSQFVGGETLEETSPVAEKLKQFHVQVIFDYGVEGKEGEENFDHARDEFIKVIQYAATQTNIPFMSVKLTGLARFDLLQKLDEESSYNDVIQGKLALEKLDDNEKNEWKKVVSRLQRICEAAKRCNIGVLIDAEESWIQDSVDAVTTQMMQKFNVEKAVVYNTAQLYRSDRLQFVKDISRFARENNFKPGIKLVRGAYMEKERKRAKELNYASPINQTKQATDDEYNAGLKFCIDPANGIYVVIGSHNEYSNLHATELIKKFGLSLNYNHIHFSQLYGMSDNITFNLAKAGCSVSKYLPFGPIKDVIPYLMRRAQENSSVSGQTGRELGLIKNEIHRRKAEK
ncbi:MAG: proline dehydrogenase family protein [Bacteroidota bacterium]|nr:proline dehydrogenase family protein [Bacteroidota bacterium]